MAARINPNNRPRALCWTCRKALGDCSWSDALVKVKGSHMSPGAYGEESLVDECPEYEKDDGRKISVNNTGVTALCGAIVLTAGKEYIEACTEEAKQMNLAFDELELLSKFYGPAKRPAPETWREDRTEPWARWSMVETPPKSSTMIQDELFFQSEWGHLVTDGNPVYIMNEIRKKAGLAPIKPRKEDA